jgi:hypothetical protein
MEQLRQLTVLLASLPLHPGHLIFLSKWPRQMPQSIPQGAINDISDDFIV